ncbi:MAG TPA: HAMP domain-containing sensor histidine kinase [Pyrinomonadaceae bacterium]|nr:HAMP domain-containing sensor histidine kinase [Pyrinomonadaceae bacterium]
MLSSGVFRDAAGKLSLRKKLTILVTVGVFLPLLGLTYLQYRSLTELQNKTKGAFKDNLRQGLTIVEQQMKQRLESIAVKTLDPIGSMNLSSSRVSEELETYFANVKRSHPEIEEIFVVGVPGEQQKTNTRSDILFAFDKARMAQSFVDGNRKYLFVHHSCTTCPPGTRQGAYLFYPLQIGFAGVLLSESFVSNDLIAGIIKKILDRHHADPALPAVAFSISDDNNHVLYANAPAQKEDLLETSFDRPFSSWKVRVGLKDTSVDELARNSFLHSAGATLLVLVFLLGGMALTIRATDREARLAQAKSNFVSNVSHELKTPLSLLSLFSEILELGRVNSEEKKTEYYRIIRHESLRLNKMIDNILDFSKIEAGRKTYNFAAGDIAEVIENVLSSYRYQISNAGFDVQTNIQPELPRVSIDREAMAQAISNLLDNAIKYSREVKRLSITTERRGSDLAIEIADQGIGIPRAEHAKVFEKFYRVGNGLVHDVKGSGLGLSLVKHIVEAHHGTISVESDVGKGSRFTILLPLGET